MSQAAAQGTAFTYQSQLNTSGTPANGNYDFTFALFNNSSTNTGQVGGTLTNLDVGVNNGLFTVTLDFGTNFPGASRWLAIGVRTNGATNFTALNPLQELTPTPYAIYAPNAGNAATAGTADSVAVSNYLSAAQIQQLYSVAENTVLTDRRLCMEGDSLTVGYNAYVLTNSSFWGNCTFAADAVAGSHLTNMLNHFYSTVATNMPNGQDIIYPSTVLFWGGENSIGAQDTADQCYGWISEEIANVHALGGQIFVSTIMESDSVTGNPNPFFEAQRVGLNELITANSAGAEGVADPDTMFYNLLGPN